MYIVCPYDSYLASCYHLRTNAVFVSFPLSITAPMLFSPFQHTPKGAPFILAKPALLTTAQPVFRGFNVRFYFYYLFHLTTLLYYVLYLHE